MLSGKAIRRWYKIHKWSSLICTAFMLLLCITGLPLIFYHEIDHATGYSVDPPELPGIDGRVSLDEIVGDAKRRKPGDVVTFLMQDEDEPAAWSVTLAEAPDAPAASAFYTYDVRTGEFLNDYPLEQGFMHVMWKLHVDLFAGLSGTLFLGLMGLLLVLALISGTVLYGPFMRKLSFGTVRRARAPRLKWLDIHNLLGIVTLAWLTVVGLTGAVNTLARPLQGLWQMTELAEMTAPYQGRPPPETIAPVDEVVKAALAAEPGMEFFFMAFPGNPFAGEHHFAAFMRGSTPLKSRLLKPVLVDARTAAISDSRELPWYLSTLLLSQPLHFGDYGGMPLKFLWALLDILSIVVLGSGLYLWLKKGNGGVEELLAKRRASSAA